MDNRLSLPGEDNPGRTQKHKQMLKTRNELKDMLNYEQEALCRAREFYGEGSDQFKRQQNRFQQLSTSYGEGIEMFEDKVYGKQGKLF